MSAIVWVLALAAAQLSPDTLSDRARELASSGKVDEAEGLWRQAVEKAPSHFASLFNLGYLSAQRHKDAEAVEWLRRAARVNPRDFNTHYLLGSALARQEKTDDALRAWREALALQPGNRKLMQVMCVEYSKGRLFRRGGAPRGTGLTRGAGRCQPLLSGDAGASGRRTTRGGCDVSPWRAGHCSTARTRRERT